MIRAPGLVILWNRFNDCRARFGPPKSPMSFPIMRMVSNLPSLESTSVIDLTLTLNSPLSLQTLTAKGELSNPRDIVAFLLEIQTIFHTPTANVENSPFHISCSLSLSERPVLVLRQIVLRVSLTRVNESVISFYDLNYLAALVEVVLLMTISVLTIL